MKKYLLALFCAATLCATATNSPYLYKVYDFLPAPGQFVNYIPDWEDGDTYADMIARVEENICGEETPGMISLGSFGGYVIVGFDHPVVNVSGEYDFKIFGNAYVSNLYSSGGSCEPGIVMVSVDENGDGIPNDTWYELAGSAYSNSRHNYEITYYRPDENKTKQPSTTDNYINDVTYVRWTSNNPDAAEGYVCRNVFHSQSYWPQWYEGDTMTFRGTLLPTNAEDLGTGGSQYWVQYFFDWGYVDNLPTATDPGFNIDWAVDSNGNSVKLKQIDFIKIYCAENQSCGWLGETSTEVCGGRDLHPDAVAAVTDITVDADDDAPTIYYNLQGVRVTNPGPGIYITRHGKVRIN
jgi:hypothetical protein